METSGENKRLSASRISRRKLLQGGAVAVGAASIGLMGCTEEKEAAKATAVAGLPYGAPGDWDAITEEATELLRRFLITRLSDVSLSTSSGVKPAMASASKPRNAARMPGYLVSTTLHEMPVWNTASLITSR